jgi:preprotein translocase subunit YajC
MAPPPAGTEATGGSALMSFLPIILMFVVMYIFFILPKSREAKKTDEMRRALKEGDRVLTIAGIIGTVAHVKEDLITVRTGDGTKLDFEKAAIVRRIEPAGEKK